MAALVGLSACDPFAAPPLDPATVQQKSTTDICYQIGVAKVGAGNQTDFSVGMEELTRRAEFSRKDLAAIADTRVYIGMPEDAALCSIGLPPSDVNVTTTGYSVRKQFVYSTVMYLYTENGKVTAIQD